MSLQGKIYTKYVMAINKIVRAALKPNVEYDNINDIDLTEIKRLKSEYGIGGMILMEQYFTNQNIYLQVC